MRCARLEATLGAALLLAAALSAGCGADAARTTTAVRDTLPNGAVRLHYASLDAAPEPLPRELSIGVVDGQPYEIFGDIRSIDADAAGNIYVLDHQASEVRVFDADGRYLRTLTRRGNGPGELAAANGMMLARDTLWIQDHGQWQMIALDVNGLELTRVPMHVLSYGFMWDGTIDDSGRFWKPISHSDDDLPRPPPEGLVEGTNRSYMKWLDRSTGSTDSIFLGEEGYRTYIARRGRGYSYRGVPFSARPITIVDPAGGFWRTSADEYRIARLDERGDTVLVIEGDVPAAPVTGEQRDRFVADVVEADAGMRRAAEEMVALAPDTHPVLDQLIVDDQGLLWARRLARDGEATRYDLFTRDGEYVRSVTLTFRPSQYLPLRIRSGKIYALVLDSLDVATVVRAGAPSVPDM